MQNIFLSQVLCKGHLFSGDILAKTHASDNKEADKLCKICTNDVKT